MDKDDFGDRMKSMERVETAHRFDPNLPVVARIDGRGFSKFTKGMLRPFDARMSMVMIETTRLLVAQTHAQMGYTQSDEISLLFANKENSSFMFDGKKVKMTSVFAALATACFTRMLMQTHGMEKFVDRMPHFDARVFSVPSRTEAANQFLWREQDASKNAISMAAHHYHSHKNLQGKNSAQKIAMLQESGVDFHDYPDFFKRGTFLRRVLETRTLTDDERSLIPEDKRPAASTTYLRGTVKTIPMPSFRTVGNREDVLFEGALPILKEAD